MHFQHVLGGFNIYHVTFEDKSTTLLGLHIRNQLPESMRTEFSFQFFKRSLMDWFGPKCKCKLAVIWIIDPIFILCNKPNLTIFLTVTWLPKNLLWTSAVGTALLTL